MNNVLINWWRSRQFHQALQRHNVQRAEYLFQEIQQSKVKLSLLEKTWLEKREAEQKLAYYTKELSLSRQQSKSKRTGADSKIFQPELSQTISNLLNLKPVGYDTNLLQCTGIDQPVFEQLEKLLVEYLQPHLVRENPLALKHAYQEIRKIQAGEDPDYSVQLVGLIYLLEYFLTNVYSSYLAWFLVYQSGLLRPQLKILDVAAGPATVLFGLATFLETLYRESADQPFPLSEPQICYHWLEPQRSFQVVGSRFWRDFINQFQIAQNTFWRIDNSNLFDLFHVDQSTHLPKDFFDFLVISHCFFWDEEERKKSYQVYGQLCRTHLSLDGYALFIIQQYKLFSLYDLKPSYANEQQVVHDFTKAMGLRLEWFKCLSSTGHRGKIKNFGEFAAHNLPMQKMLGSLRRECLNIKFDPAYSIDDYIILARR